MTGWSGFRECKSAAVAFLHQSIIAILIFSIGVTPAFAGPNNPARLNTEPELELLVGQRFIVYENGEVSNSHEPIDFLNTYGRLNRGLVGFSITNLNQIVPYIEETADGAYRLNVVYERETRFFNYNGSRISIPSEKKLLSTASDWNSIFVLDETGQVFLIDKNRIKHSFGKEPLKILSVLKWSLPAEASEFEIVLYDGPHSLSSRDLSVPEHLREEVWRTGDLMLTANVNGKREIIDRQSRANLLRAGFIQEIKLALIGANYNSDGAERLSDFLGHYVEFQGAIAEYVDANPEIFQEEALGEDLRKIFASFDGQASLAGLNALLSQVKTNSETARVVGEKLERSKNLRLSPLSHSLLKSILKGESSEDWMKARLIKILGLIETAYQDQEAVGISDELRKNLGAFRAWNVENGGSNNLAIGLQQAFSDEEWLALEVYLTERMGWRDDQKALLQQMFLILRKSKLSPGWGLLEECQSLAMFELKEKLHAYIDLHSEDQDIAELRNLSEQLEKSFQTHSGEAQAAAIDAIAKRLKDQPTFASLDVLIALDAEMDSDAARSRMIEEAQLIHPRSLGLLEHMKRHPAAKKFFEFRRNFLDVPNLLMAAGFGLVGATAYTSLGPTISDTLGEAIPILTARDRLPDLMKAWVMQFGFFMTIVTVYRGLARVFVDKEHGVGYFAQKIGKDAFSLLSFPFVAGLFRGVLRQKNILHAAEHGLWPLGADGALHAYGEDSRQRAAESLANETRAHEFRLAVARNMALKHSLRIAAEAEGFRLEGEDWQEVLRSYFDQKSKMMRDLSDTYSASMSEALQQRDMEALSRINLQYSEDSRRLLEIFERIEIKTRNLIIVSRTKALKSHALKNFDFNKLNLEKAEVGLLDSYFQELVRRESTNSRFVNWVKRLQATVGYNARYRSARILNYPLGLYESLRRATPRKDIGLSIFNAYRGDMITQYGVGGFMSGYPFEEFLEKAGYTLRANPENPLELYAQPNEAIRDPSGKIIGFDENTPAPIYLLNTHPNEMTSLLEQHTLILTASMAMAITEIGSDTSTRDPYVLIELRDNEREEGFWRSAVGFVKSSLKIREAGYDQFLNARLKNIFVMAQPIGIILGIFRMGIAGLSFPVAFGQFIFVSGWKFPFYYWPWMILGRGFGHLGAKLATEYRSFSLSRNLLRIHLDNGNRLGASLSAFSMIKMYQDKHRATDFMKTLMKKSLDDWSLDELRHLLKEADNKPAVYHSFNNALNETANLWAGAFLTTVLGLGFLATTMNMVDFVFAVTVGATGLLVFPAAVGAIRLFDKVMRRTGDPMSRAWENSNKAVERERQPLSHLSALIEQRRAEAISKIRVSDKPENEKLMEISQVNAQFDEELAQLKADIGARGETRIGTVQKIIRASSAAGKALVQSCRGKLSEVGTKAAPVGRQ